MYSPHWYVTHPCRGAVRRACARGVAGAALLWVCAAAHAQPDAFPARPVYVDTLLRLVSTQQSGYWPYQPRAARMEGVRFPRSLMTMASNGRNPTSQSSELALRLDGRYARFQAMVGRDDEDHVDGPAYCYFEVWGDGKRLFKSEAIRSSKTQVRAGPSVSKRKTPQEVDVSVRGVRDLRLITRYAIEFSQEAPWVRRASGCVWGNARLLPPLPPRPEALVPNEALRNAVRTAALRLAGKVGTSRTYAKRLPLALGITPLRVEVNAPGEELGIRSLLAQQLLGVRQGLGPVFRPLAFPDAAALVALLPPDAPERASADAVAAAGKSARADMVLLGALSREASGWQIHLRLLDVATGKATAFITVPVSTAQN